MGHAYRSAYQHMIGMRLAETRLAREMLVPLLPRLRSIRAARAARILGGGVGLAGACATVVFAWDGTDADMTDLLVGSGGAAVGTYVLTRVVLGLLGLFAPSAPPTPRLTGALDVDLARLDAADPRHGIARRLPAHEGWSTALPLAAIALLAPLTLHWMLVGAAGSESAESFGRWIRMSLVIVGHAHLALMALAIRFARKMARASAAELGAMSIHREWAKAWAITIGVSAVPGVLLLAVPPILTAVTGIAFIPLVFVMARRIVMTERAALELAEEALQVRVDVDTAQAATALEEAACGEVALGSADEDGLRRAALRA